MLEEVEEDGAEDDQAEDDLLAARNSRDQAKTDLRTAILNYLLQSDQLRVARDGTLQPLPGMEGTGTPANSTPPADPE